MACRRKNLESYLISRTKICSYGNFKAYSFNGSMFKEPRVAPVVAAFRLLVMPVCLQALRDCQR